MKSHITSHTNAQESHEELDNAACECEQGCERRQLMRKLRREEGHDGCGSKVEVTRRPKHHVDKAAHECRVQAIL